MASLRMTVKQLQEGASQVQKDYISWVVRNPKAIQNLESTSRLLTYALHGYLQDISKVLPELLYSSIQLVSFFNERIVAKHYDNKPTTCNGHVSSPSDAPSVVAATLSQEMKHRQNRIQRIRTILTVIDIAEVLLEVAARQLWGETGRWIFIFLLQLTKTVLRGVLLLYYKIGMIGGTTTISRGSFNPSVREETHSFVLSHTGKVIRKSENAQPIGKRDWQALSYTIPPTPQELPTKRLIAEILHLSRPLLHLATMGAWGRKSWIPWLTAFFMDCGSIHLHNSSVSTLRPREKRELTRRMYCLLLYLLRSPFYDNHFKSRLIGTLLFISRTIPFCGNLMDLVLHSIPEWLDIYSYIWTDK